MSDDFDDDDFKDPLLRELWSDLCRRRAFRNVIDGLDDEDYDEIREAWVKIANEHVDGRKCIVHGCENRFNQGKFVGDLCSPCFRMLSNGSLEHPHAYGTTFLHAMRDELVRLRQVQGESSMSDDESQEDPILVLKELVDCYERDPQDFSVASWRLVQDARNVIAGRPTSVHDSIARLREKVEALEQLRPVWAQGHTRDSVAAQVNGTALAQLWALLGAKDQTDAVQKLKALLK